MATPIASTPTRSRRSRLGRWRRTVAVTAASGMTVALLQAVPVAHAATGFRPAKPDLGKPIPVTKVAPVIAQKAPASSRSAAPASATLPTGTSTISLAPATASSPGASSKITTRAAAAGSTPPATVAGQWQPTTGSSAAVGIAVAAAKPSTPGLSAGSPGRITVSVLTAAQARAAGVTGASPLVLKLTRADGKPGVGSVAVRVSNRLLNSFYGADYASRVRWEQLPATTPAPSGPPTDGSNTAGRPVAQAADAPDDATVLTPQVSADAVLVQATSTATSSTGTGSFAAAPLKSASSWQASAQTGAFTWSDPLRTPPAAAGPSPDLALSYDAQLVDGETGSTNNQPSDIGEGWSLAGGGSISRSYDACATSDRTRITGSGDLCFGTDNATVTLAGHSGALVKSSDGSWHLQGDDNTRVQYLTSSNGNGTYDGDYWKLTTTDGTQYFFGLYKLPGYQSGDRVTGSTNNVSVCGTAATACSGKAGTGTTAGTETPIHYEAYQWNLDYVLDVHGNAEALYYSKQQGYYDENNSGRVALNRASQLTEIDYGIANNSPYAANAASDKVLLSYLARCETGASGEPSTACTSTTSPTTPPSTADAVYWPDTPWDQYCAVSPCTSEPSPTFWSSSMLSTITTEYLSGSTYANVDTWTLGHSFPTPGDGTSAALWLTQIGHTGYSGSASLATPTIVFHGITMQNRVWVTDGLAPLDKYRISSIDTDTGAIISIGYSAQDCTPSMIPALNAAPQSNTHRCFPQWWTPDTSPPQAAALDWFHKYLVTSVVSNPETGGAADQATETDYTYLGSPAWKFNTAPGVQDSQRTWSVWAGYGQVEIRVGDPNQPSQQHTTDYLYFRGLQGDADGSLTQPTSSTRSEQTTHLTASTGATADDLPQFAGDVFEQITRVGSSGGTGESTTPVLSDTVSMPWTSPATGSTTHSYTYIDPNDASKVYQASFTQASFFTGTTSTTTTGSLSSGGTRSSVTTTSYDPSTGLPTSINTDSYDTSSSGTVSGSVQTCKTITYTSPNSTAWIVGLPARELTVGVACGATVSYPASTSVSRADVVADTASYYDSSTTLGAAPSKGDLTQAAVAIGYSGSTPTWRVTTTSTYDSLGRIKTATDPNAPGGASVTTTAYTPTASGPTTTTAVSTTTSANSTAWTTTTASNPAWGEPIKVTDQNGLVTTASYDALGRLTGVWQPNRPQASNPTPSTGYAYTLSTTSPSVLTTTTLTPAGGTVTAYTIVDGAGRTVQTQAPSEGGGILVTDTSYDANGQTSVVSAPYYATGTPSGTLVHPTITLPSQTETTYDGAGRTTASILLDQGSEAWRTTTSYPGVDRTDTVPPAGGTPTSTYTNPQGQTSALTQYLSTGISGTTETTSYGYDAAGKMTSMSKPGTGNQGSDSWSWTFNVLGQQIKAVDPDTGTTSSTYDADGDLSTSTDNNAHTLAFTYDGLRRKTGEYSVTSPTSTPASGTQLASWSYDQSTLNATTTTDLGALTSATSYVGGTAGQPKSGTAYTKTTSKYDSLGHPLSQTVTLGAGAGSALAGSYTTTYSYGANGAIGYQDDPAEGGLPNELIESSYDSLGNPGAYGTSVTDYVSGVTYNHTNQVAQISQINTTAVYHTPTYDPGTLRLTEDLVQRNTTSNAVVSDDRYTYDNAGLLTEDSNVTADPTAGTDTQCFSYDQLENLTAAWTPTSNDCSTPPSTSMSFGGPAPYWTGYSTDPATGNRTSTTTRTINDGTATSSNTATYTYPAAGSSPGSSGAGSGGPNAVSSIANSDGAPTQTYSYDADGATTSLPGHSINYNSKELPGTQTVAGTSETDIYDADGNLLISTDPSNGTSAYLGDTQLHVAAGSTAIAGSRTYTFGGIPVAERDTQPGATTSTLVYLDADPQGTATATIADTNAAVTRRYYDPFGNPRGATPTWPNSTAPSTGSHGFLNAPSDLLTTPTNGTAPTDPITQLGARQYDPTLGRFLTVDPLLDPSDPQQANGYSYANNDPANMSDPAGAEPHDNACDGLSGANATACHDYSYGSGPQPAGGYDSGGVCETDSQCMRNTDYGSPGAPVSAKKVTDYSKPIPSGYHMSWGSDGQALLVPNGMHPEGPNYVLVFDPPPPAGPGPVSDINYCGPLAIICDILPINAIINCGAHPSGEGCLDAGGQTALTGLTVVKGLGALKALTAADSAGSVSSQVADLLGRVKAIAGDHGLPLAKFGDGYLWANKDANLALRTSEQVAAVQARGFTRSEITTIRDYYQAVDVASGGANPSASYRAGLMQYYLDNWGN